LEKTHEIKKNADNSHFSKSFPQTSLSTRNATALKTSSLSVALV